MKLTKLQREALTIMAASARPWPIYRFRSGPRMMRRDATWTAVPERQVQSLVASGLLAPVEADGLPSRIAYWLIIDAGRAAVAPPVEPVVEPEPKPAPSRRRRQRRI